MNSLALSPVTRLMSFDLFQISFFFFFADWFVRLLSKLVLSALAYWSGGVVWALPITVQSHKWPIAIYIARHFPLLPPVASFSFEFWLVRCTFCAAITPWFLSFWSYRSHIKLNQIPIVLPRFVKSIFSGRASVRPVFCLDAISARYFKNR